jgi:hypothetical protein
VLICVKAHNDIGPQWHYTDVGHVKMASALMQYVRMKFGWEVEEMASGPEVLSGKSVFTFQWRLVADDHHAGTTYWNDEPSY